MRISNFKQMKKLFILFNFIFLSYSGFAQWEYAYFVLDAGVSHNFTGPVPDSVYNTFITTPDGQYQLYRKTENQPNNYLPYSMGRFIGIDFHYDLKSDKGGIIIGAKYNINSFKYQYVTLNKTYGLSMQYNTYSLSIPIYFKIATTKHGKQMFKQQKYYLIGGQYNYNLFLKETHKPNWTSQTSTRWGSPSEYLAGSYSFFAGINYYTFRLTLEYTPRTFFNTLYKDNNDVPIYQSSKGNYLFVKTSFTLPLNDWIFLTSWRAEKIRRKLKFGR
jgi:hypothetical protein